MSDSGQESAQDRADSYSSNTGSIEGYEDELPSEQDHFSPNDSEDQQESASLVEEEESFQVMEDKKILDKLKEEDNMAPVPKEQRLTLNCISKYEYARVIGMRAMQIAANAPLYLDNPLEELKGLSAMQLAEREFKAKKIPFIVRRVLPNNTYEDWPLHELENVNV